MDTTLKLGCKFSPPPKDLFRVPVLRIPTSFPVVYLQLEFGTLLSGMTDIGPVLQIFSAKMDGTLEIGPPVALTYTLNGKASDKQSILANIAGTTGLAYKASADTITMDRPSDFLHRVLTKTGISTYQGCSQLTPDIVECLVFNLDLSAKRTGILAAALAAPACTISSGFVRGLLQ